MNYFRRIVYLGQWNRMGCESCRAQGDTLHCTTVLLVSAAPDIWNDSKHLGVFLEGSCWKG